MATHNFPLGINHNPIVVNLYNYDESDVDHPIPPSSNFIITEDDDQIVSESGDKLITE